MILLFQKTAAVHRQDFEFERILFHHFLAIFVGLVNIVLIVGINSFDAEDVEIVPFCQYLEGVISIDRSQR